MIGGINVRVAEGVRVKLKGGGLVGGRSMDEAAGNGPEITVLACTLIGGVRVTHGA